MHDRSRAGGEATGSPALRRPTDILIWAIIGLQIIIGVGAYPFLPAVVPIHYGINGQANNYGPKWVATLLWPVLSIVIWFLRARQVAGPHLDGRRGEAPDIRSRTMVSAAAILLLLTIQIVTTANHLGMAFDLIFAVNLGLGALLVFMGNYMGKLRRNFWIGIRTPWTLTSEAVWERTHRVGGWLFVACGLLCMALSFVPALRLRATVPLILLVGVFLYIYSYLCYRRLDENGARS